MDCIAYVWNIFKKEKNYYNTFMGRNFYTCFVFNNFLRLYIFYPINKQNHPEKGDFLFEKFTWVRVKQLKFQKIKNRIITTLINATVLCHCLPQNLVLGLFFVPISLACTTGFSMNVGTKPLMLFTTFSLNFNVDPLDVFAF